eukprot:COSAG02_NODE_35619_length_465_cov_20.808743_2_plen_90_part_01
MGVVGLWGCGVLLIQSEKGKLDRRNISEIWNLNPQSRNPGTPIKICIHCIMDKLDADLHGKILSNLNPRDIARAGGANKALRTASHNEFH